MDEFIFLFRIWINKNRKELKFLLFSFSLTLNWNINFFQLFVLFTFQIQLNNLMNRWSWGLTSPLEHSNWRYAMSVKKPITVRASSFNPIRMTRIYLRSQKGWMARILVIQNGCTWEFWGMEIKEQKIK